MKTGLRVGADSIYLADGVAAADPARGVIYYVGDSLNSFQMAQAPKQLFQYRFNSMVITKIH